MPTAAEIKAGAKNATALDFTCSKLDAAHGNGLELKFTKDLNLVDKTSKTKVFDPKLKF